jgi:hypothetical protein
MIPDIFNVDYAPFFKRCRFYEFITSLLTITFFISVFAQNFIIMYKENDLSVSILVTSFCDIAFF